MKKFLIILAFFPLSLFAQQSVLSSFNGYGDIVNVIDVDPTDSLFTIEINNFYGSPRFQPFGPWIAQDVQVGMVMWVDCARFVITNVNSASFSTMNIDVKVPSVDWNLGVATPLPNSRCAVVFEDQYLLTALPAPADGNSGALSGINNTLFACMLNHYSQALLVTKNSVNEITDYVAGLDTIPSEAPGPNIGETWRNSVGQLFYSNGTQWLTDKEVKFSNASLEGLPSYLYKLGIDTLGQDTLYISNNGIFRRFQSGLVYKEGYGINIFATDSIEVDTNQIATQNDLTPFISGTGANGQVTFWTGLKTQSGSNNLFWDNTNGRLGLGITVPLARFHQSQTQGVFGRYDITNANANQNRGVWEFYTNTAATPDFFGRFGFKFEGGVNNASKQYQVHVSDATNPRLVVNGVGDVGIATITPAARLHVVGADALSTGWTAQFHNSSTNNALMIRNDGNIGLSTNAPARTLHVAGTMRLTGNAGTATETLGRDASGDISGVPFSTIVTSGGGLTGNGVVNYLSQYNSTSTLDTTGIIWVGGRMGLRVAAPTATLDISTPGTSASINALAIQNSTPSTILGVRQNGDIFGLSGIFYQASDGRLITDRIRSINTSTGIVQITGGTTGLASVQIGSWTTVTKTSGDYGLLAYNFGGFQPTSGNATFNFQDFSGVINQTGGANGITRGMYIRPTLTSAADWRSIEWNNSSGFGLYGIGTAPNYINGNLLLGNLINNARLRVQGPAATASTFGLIVTNSDTTTANATLVVRDDKRVGIGTNAPTDQLHTTGSVRLQNYPNTLNSTGNPVNVLSTSSTGVVESHPISEVISSAGGVTGSGVDTRVAYWNGTSSLTNDANFRFLGSATGGNSGLLVGAIQFNGFGDNTSTSGQGFASPGANRTLYIKSGTNNNANDVAGIELNTGVLSNRTASASFIGLRIFSDLQSPAGTLTSYTQVRTDPVLRHALTTYTGFDYNPSFNVAPTNHYAATFRSGLVGIGLSAPTAQLHVRSTGTTSSNTALLVQNGAATPANLLSVLDNGDVGIGTNAPGARLQINGSGNTSSTSSLRLVDNNSTQYFNATDDGQLTLGKNITLSTASSYRVFQGSPILTNTVSGGLLQDVAFFSGGLTYAGSEPFSGARAMQFAASNRNTATSNQIWGAYFVAQNETTTARASQIRGMDILLINNATGGTISEVSGLTVRVPTHAVGSTITNTIGINILDLTPTTAGTQTNVYSIYSSDENARMYHAGNVGIGSSVQSPTRTLDINGETRIRDLTTTTATGLVGADADGVLSNVTFASAVSQGGGLTGNGVTNYLAQYNSSNTLDTTGIIWTGGRMGIGTATPSATFDVVGTVDFQNPTTAFDAAIVGAELLTTGTGTNWTGTGFSTGYTHTVGSTAALVAATSPANATYYQIVITTTGRTAGSFTFSFGGYTSATISADGTTTIGPLTTSTSPLTITPTTDFNGTVSATIKSIGSSSAVFKLVNSGGTTVFEQRASNSDNNMFLGRLAGLRNTTGVANTFIGSQAGQNNTTASFNTFIGNGAGSANVIGESNLFIGAGAGGSNRSGSNNFFMGRSAGINNTVGSSNLAIGTSSGVSLVRGNSNVYLGGNTGQNNVSGSNNVLIGVLAGRFYSESSLADTSINNSIFIGTDTRSNLLGQTNQIIIANSGRGLGSNTTRIGNSNTIQTHLDGRLTIGNTFYDSRVAARIVGADASTTNYSLVVTDSDGATSTTVDPNFVVRNDGLVGIGTYSPTAKLEISPSANQSAFVLSNYSLTGSNNQSAINIEGTWNTTGNPTFIRANLTNTASNANSILFQLAVNNTNAFAFRTRGVFELGAGCEIFTANSTGGTVFGGTNLGFYNLTPTNSNLYGSFAFVGSNITGTTGTFNQLHINRTFAPTSGTSLYKVMHLTSTINQTGGANGITRGIHIDPTLTSAADWRSIEWSNNTGYGLYGAGTAPNYLAGALGIGAAVDGTSGYNLRVTKPFNTVATARGIISDASIGTGPTTVTYFGASGNAGATANVTNLFYYNANQSSFASGSVIGTQIGYNVGEEMVGATNNYGFMGRLPSGANRWNLYMSGTANNYLAGSLGIGSTTPARSLHVQGEARISDLTTDTPTRIVGADADGDLGEITLGSGLSITSGVLNTSSTLNTGSGTAGQVTFWNGTNSITGSNNLFWDSGNSRLGIGTTTPGATFHVQGTSNLVGLISISGDIVPTLTNTYSLGSSSFGFASMYAGSNGIWYFGSNEFARRGGSGGVEFSTAGNNLIIFNSGRTAEIVRFTSTNRNLLLGTTSDVARLHVAGAGTTSGYGLIVTDVNNNTATASLVVQDNGRVGIGTNAPATKLDVIGDVEFQNPTASFDGPTFGTELLTTGSGTGWTGSNYTTGYTHSDTNFTNVLTSVFTPTNGTIYRVVVTCSGRTVGTATVTFGGKTVTTFTSNTTVTLDDITTSTAALVVTPSKTFNGTITASVKLISVSSAQFIGKNSSGTTVYEERLSSTNIFQGQNVGRYNTTGSTNIFQGQNAGRNNTSGFGNVFQGSSAGYSNTAGYYNVFQGPSAGYSNTTGFSNIFQGPGAGFSNTTGASNIFQGVDAGRANTTGNNNIFQGVRAGRLNTTGSGNVFQGLEAGSSNTTGNYNIFIGGYTGFLNTSANYNFFVGLNAGYSNTTGNNNIFQGYNAAYSNTTGNSNVVIGNLAGRYVSYGTNVPNHRLNNSILIGYDARTLDSLQTNQIVIGYEGRGLGNNTTRIGNSSTVQTHLDGRLTVGNTLYDANTTARIVGLNNTSSTYALVVTNSTAGTNTTSAPALVVTNEQNVGIGTYSPGAKLQVNGSGNTSATASILTVNSDNVTTFRVGNSGIISANALISVTGLLSLYARENLTNGIAVIPNNNTTITSGIRTTFNISDNFVPTSGTGTFRVLTLNPTINQTGGANGITNGILIDPSITLAANWRSVQWNNNTGFGLYGEGTAPNRLNGILSLPSTSEASPGLQFNSNSAVGLYSSDVNNIGLVSGDRKQLLLEKAATNLLLQSENIATTWIQLGGTSATTLTTNVATAPNGTMTADKIVCNFNLNYGIRQTLIGTFLAGRTYTFSVWARTDSTNILALDINDATASIKKMALTNNWVRYSTTFTFTSNTTNPFVDITFDNVLQNALNKHMYVWGMQFEESLNPTMYIPTTTVSASKLSGFYFVDSTTVEMSIIDRKVGINNSNPAKSLHVTGEVRISDLDNGVATRIVGATADGDLDELTLGSGLSITSGTISVTNPISASEVFIESSTATTIDLDANTGVVKDVNGTNASFTLPTDLSRLNVYKNGIRLARTGTATTRDFSVNTGTNEITFTTALLSTDRIVIVKI